jgi:hypothetical protein
MYRIIWRGLRRVNSSSRHDNSDVALERSNRLAQSGIPPFLKVRLKVTTAESLPVPLSIYRDDGHISLNTENPLIEEIVAVRASAPATENHQVSNGL